MLHDNEKVLVKIRQLYESLFSHNGYGEMKIEMRILKKGQKEIIIHCGKQYRYVVDFVQRQNEDCKETAFEKQIENCSKASVDSGIVTEVLPGNSPGKKEVV